jgi:hypothetical protein
MKKVKEDVKELNRLGRLGLIHPYDVDLKIGECNLEGYTLQTKIHLLSRAIYEIEQASVQIVVDGMIPDGITLPKLPEYQAKILFKVNRRKYSCPIWLNKYATKVAFSTL